MTRARRSGFLHAAQDRGGYAAHDRSGDYNHGHSGAAGDRDAPGRGALRRHSGGGCALSGESTALGPLTALPLVLLPVLTMLLLLLCCCFPGVTALLLLRSY